MTCVITGRARTWVNAFRPTNPVAPSTKTFIGHPRKNIAFAGSIVSILKPPRQRPVLFVGEG